MQRPAAIRTTAIQLGAAAFAIRAFLRTCVTHIVVRKSRPAAIACLFHCVPSLWKGVQGAFEVGDQVAGVLDSAGEPDKRWGNAGGS